MEPEAGKRIWFSLSIEEVKEYEGFQEMAKVRRRHQSRDRPVGAPARAMDDAALRPGERVGHFEFRPSRLR